MKAIWQMWKAELSDDIVQKIITECEYYDPVDAQIGFGGETPQTDKVRSSTVRWVTPTDTNSQFITDILWRYAARANRDVFGFDINDIYDIQYTIYEAENKGHYDWHFDTFWGNPMMNDRKLSVTIQLSDSDDYEGGDFLFDSAYTPPSKQELRQKGTILVFPSPIMHKVETVTKGTRKSLVAWIEGPKFR